MARLQNVVEDCPPNTQQDTWCCTFFDGVFADTAAATARRLNVEITNIPSFYIAHVNEGIPSAYDAIATMEFPPTEKMPTHDPSAHHCSSTATHWACTSSSSSASPLRRSAHEAQIPGVIFGGDPNADAPGHHVFRRLRPARDVSPQDRRWDRRPVLAFFRISEDTRSTLVKILDPGILEAYQYLQSVVRCILMTVTA